MPGLRDTVKKAFYLGVGLVSYAGDKASSTIGELRQQAQKLADEMVERGEITAEEARKLVDEMLASAQQQVSPPKSPKKKTPSEPRLIEISDEDSSPEDDENVNDLRNQVTELQKELRRLQQDQSQSKLKIDN